MKFTLALVEAGTESGARNFRHVHDHQGVLAGGESGVALVGENGDVLGDGGQFLEQARLAGLVERLSPPAEQVLLEHRVGQ